jgi:hypothetical protein
MTQLQKKAELILRQHAAGLNVDPDDLEWAVNLALMNPGRLKK